MMQLSAGPGRSRRCRGCSSLGGGAGTTSSIAGFIGLSARKQQWRGTPARAHPRQPISDAACKIDLPAVQGHSYGAAICIMNMPRPALQKVLCLLPQRRIRCCPNPATAFSSPSNVPKVTKAPNVPAETSGTKNPIAPNHATFPTCSRIHWRLAPPMARALPRGPLSGPRCGL